MKIKCTSKGYTLSNIPAEQLAVVMYLLGNIHSSCFQDSPVNGEIYSGDVFFAVLAEHELDSFKNFFSDLNINIDKLLAE